MRWKGLNLAVYLKPQNCLRSAQILALQHAAILQLQCIGNADSGEQQHSGRRE